MTPFDWKTSAVVMLAVPPFASVMTIMPLDGMVKVRGSPSTVVRVAVPPPFLIFLAISLASILPGTTW